MTDNKESPSDGQRHRGRGQRVWIVLGVVGFLALAAVVGLQATMNNHNRQRQDAIDFHRREAADALRRAEDGLRRFGKQ